MSPEEYLQYEMQRRGQAPFPKEAEPTATMGPEEASQPTWYQKAGRFAVENLEIPVGFTGALYGAAAGASRGAMAGAPGGPKGVFAGMLIGGAIGSGVGSLMSDTLTGKEADYQDAMKEAALSMGIDAATFGLWTKGLKPAWYATQEALGYTAKESVEAAMKSAKLGEEVGTRESLLATQNILSRSGASLTPFQTGQANAAQIVGQRIAEVGIGSSRIMTENANKVNTATRQGLEEIMSKAVDDVALDASTLGRTLFDGIDAGRKAMFQVYGTGLDEIQKDLARTIVPTKSLKDSLIAFRKQYDYGGTTPGSSVQNSLDDSALRFIDEQIDFLTSNKSIKASDLISFEKHLSNQLSGFTDINTYNSVAARQLTELSKLTKNEIGSIFARANPEAAAKYSALKKEYHTSMEGILPELTGKIVEKAGKGAYTALGELITKNGNIDNINALFKSIDTSYSLIPAETLAKLPVKTAQEAKELIKKSYLKHLFPDIGPTFQVGDYAHLAKRFGDPTEAARFKLIMGDDYLRTKQLVNLMYEASQKPTSNIGELVLKSKEYAAAATIYGSAQVGGMVTGGATAATILVGPVVLAKMSTNPKRMAKLIAFEKKKFATTDAMELAAVNLVVDLMNSLPEEERAEIRGEIIRQSSMQKEAQEAYNRALQQMQIQEEAAKNRQNIHQQPMP